MARKYYPKTIAQNKEKFKISQAEEYLDRTNGLGYNLGQAALMSAGTIADIGFNTLGNNLNGETEEFAYGGVSGKPNANVEGGEFIEMPGTQGGIIDGPSHSAGGIDLSLPEGTDIFSGRVKIDGVSIAKRKEKRKKTTLKLEELLEKGRDKILERTLERKSKNNETLDQKEQELQGVVKNATQVLESDSSVGLPQYKWGTPPGQGATLPGGGIQLVGVRGEERAINKDNRIKERAINKDNRIKERSENDFSLPDFNLPDWKTTPGNIVAEAGNINSILQNNRTLSEVKANNTPNVNHYQNYGDDALGILDQTKLNIGSNMNKDLSDAQLSEDSQRSQMRNTARGVNTSRALDMATLNAGNRNEADIRYKHKNQMKEVNSQMAQTALGIDSAVMGGAATKAENDARDKGADYTAAMRNIDNNNMTSQQFAKNMNAKQKANYITNMIADMKQKGLTNQEINRAVNKVKAELGYKVKAGIA